MGSRIFYMTTAAITCGVLASAIQIIPYFASPTIVAIIIATWYGSMRDETTTINAYYKAAAKQQVTIAVHPGTVRPYAIAGPSNKHVDLSYDSKLKILTLRGHTGAVSQNDLDNLVETFK